MTKYNISIPAYLSDLTFDQLENIHKKSGDTIRKAKEVDKVGILIVNDGWVNHDFFLEEDIDKAVAKLREYVNSDKYMKHKRWQDKWHIQEAKVYPAELADMGIVYEKPQI